MDTISIWKINLALICIILSVVSAKDDVIPNAKVLYDASVNLTCASGNFDPDKVNLNQDVAIMWLLPSGDMVKPAQEHARVKVYADGKHIMVYKVSDVDFGIYNCIVATIGGSSTQYQIVQLGLNIEGPYWGDLLAKYRRNMITGGVAGAVMFSVMSVVCWLNTKHGIRMDKEYARKTGELELINGGHDNFALDMNEKVSHEYSKEEMATRL